MNEGFRDAVRRGYDELGGAYREARTGGDPPILAPLSRFVDALGPGRVLDAGCGPGVPILARLSERFEAIGLDLSREQLRLAREGVPGTTVLQGDMTALPFGDGAFDGVVAANSVIHVPRGEHATVLSEFRRVLRPGGAALVTVGAGDWEGTDPDWLGAGVEMRWSHYGPERTATLLREAGFADVEATSVEDSLDGETAVLFARALEGDGTDQSAPTRR